MTIQNVAKTIIIDTSGKVLLLRRSRDDTARPGEWDYPGGGIEAGESLVAAAVRETAEEANITLRPQQMRLVYTATGLTGDGYKSINRFVFAVVLSEDQTPTLSHEHEEYKWVPIDEVPRIFQHPVYTVALQYAIEHELIEF